MLDKMFEYLKTVYGKGKNIAVATAYSFFEDDCYTKSSTLTFYTVQSIVPFLAFLLGIAKGFGFDAYLVHLIENSFEEQKEVAAYSISIANSMLKHIKEGVVIGAGILFLVWAMINLLSYIEIVLNHIWKIKEQRPLLRQINDYLAIVILCPLILIASSSFTVFLKARIANLHGTPYLEEVGTYLLLIFNIAPWILSWVLFFLLYFLLPNGKLRLWPIIIAAILAGSFFQLWQLVLIYFQFQIFNYNIVYGAFAVLPLLLIWIQVSWLIGLAGAELAANIENVIFYEAEHKIGYQETISKKQLGLMIMLYCLQPFYTGKTPLTDIQISKAMKIPLNFTKTMLDILVKGKVLVAIELNDGLIGYHPYCDPGGLTIKDVCDIIEKSDDVKISVVISEPLKNISVLLKKMNEAEIHSEANIKLKELLTQVASPASV